MDDFFPVIIIIISTVIGIISNANKEKAKKASDERRAEAARVRMEAAKKRQAEQAKPAPQQMMMPILQPTVVEPHRPVAAPKVHVHLEPDLIAHDQNGSLESPHTEGIDPCHDGQMAPRSILQASQPEQPGIALEWSGENMVKAFIMQEVLTRPSQRRQAR